MPNALVPSAATRRSHQPLTGRSSTLPTRWTNRIAEWRRALPLPARRYSAPPFRHAARPQSAARPRAHATIADRRQLADDGNVVEIDRHWQADPPPNLGSDNLRSPLRERARLFACWPWVGASTSSTTRRTPSTFCTDPARGSIGGRYPQLSPFSNGAPARRTQQHGCWTRSEGARLSPKLMTSRMTKLDDKETKANRLSCRLHLQCLPSPRSIPQPGNTVLFPANEGVLVCRMPAVNVPRLGIRVFPSPILPTPPAIRSGRFTGQHDGFAGRLTSKGR